MVEELIGEFCKLFSYSIKFNVYYMLKNKQLSQLSLGLQAIID